jgi:integrase
MSGLVLRGNTWHIKKRYKHFPGGRLYKSTGFSKENLDLAEAYLAKQMEAARKAAEEGVRPQILWRQAAAKYLRENLHKATIEKDASHLEDMNPFIGHLPIDQVHNDTLALFKKEKKAAGLKQKSINNALSIARRILNLAAREWRHNLPNGRSITWLETAPLITLPTVNDAAKPYPLNWDEQRQLVGHLPRHLADMALFKVNTGTREQEVCQLRWDWEVEVPELNTSVFIVPAYIVDDEKSETAGDNLKGMVKNREDRLIILNKVALSVVESRRGMHPEFVFTYIKHFKEDNKKRRKSGKQGINRPINNMNNTAWKSAWKKAGLPLTRQYTRGVHNLKHTFGRRLRAAGVPNETRKVLLGHTNNDITTHYSAVEIQELIEASNKILETEGNSPSLTLLKLKAKTRAGAKVGQNSKQKKVSRKNAS